MTHLATWRRVALRWDEWRAHVRERAAAFVPVVVLAYPFEVFVAVLGLIIGLPLLVGLAAPTSLVLLLPDLVYWIYACMLAIGATTMLTGLRTKAPVVLASGLQLLGGSYAVYALATVAVAGWAVAWAVFCAFVLLAVICFMRASHFRRLVDIQRGAARIHGTGT